MSQTNQPYEHRTHPYKHPERGQGVVEYALILALVALAVVAIINVLEPAVANVFSQFVQEAPVAPPSLLSYTPPPSDTPPPPPPTAMPPGFTPSPTSTPTITPTPSQTPTPSNTPTATNTPTVTPTPTPSPNILFVVDTVGSNNLPASNADNSILTQLQSLNLLLGNVNNPILVRSEGTVQASDATGKELVVISPSVSSGPSGPGNMFQTVNVPVMVMEDGLLDDMGMVGGNGGNYHGNQGNQTALTIVGSGHPLAANLSNQNYTVYGSNSSLVYGRAEAGAIKIATVVGNSNRSTIFAFAQGGAMPASPWTAPARRVSFFMYEGVVFTSTTTQGQLLFNAAVCWSMTGSACP